MLRVSQPLLFFLRFPPRLFARKDKGYPLHGGYSSRLFSYRCGTRARTTPTPRGWFVCSVLSVPGWCGHRRRLSVCIAVACHLYLLLFLMDAVARVGAIRELSRVLAWKGLL